jgi:two-component system sensor histidine kinase RegB
MSYQPLKGDETAIMRTEHITWAWLQRLRWAALTGQTVTIVFCLDVLRMPLPVGPLLAFLLITLVSQLALWGASNRWLQPRSSLVGGLLSLDILLLTGLLYYTGGPSNPFSTFYLIHIAMAASLLGTGWTWGLLALAMVCFGGLFWRNVPLSYPLRDEPICGLLPMQLHFGGMFVALALTGACLAWFVARLNTQLRQRDVALHLAELRAERESRFASLVTLAAGVAHEINSPLATISVAARELEREAECGHPPAVLVGDARLIRAEVERCRVILGRLHARAGNGPHDSPVDCRADDLAKALRASLPKNQSDRLEFACPDSNILIRAPRAALLQALSNLISNASDAAPPNSAVRLEIATNQLESTFTVSDRGPGLAREVAGRVGEPFVTTREPGKGTGLGLFLVRRFAEQTGGRFDIQSTPGAGTKARLEIPRGAAL